MPIDAVVFDLGGVLVDWDRRYLYERLIPDASARSWFLSSVCDLQWNARMDRGLPFSDGIREKQAEHPEHAELISAYFEHWQEMLRGPIEGSVRHLERLKREGVPLYALTNWSAETFPVAQARFSFLGHFEGVVVSGVEGVAKPEEEIYLRLIDRYHLTVERTLFIDDSAPNVETARRLGFVAVHFTDPDALGNALREHGLLPGTVGRLGDPGPAC